MLKYGFGVTITIPVVLAGALWWFQRRLIYPADFPEGSRTMVPKPTDAAMPYEDVTLTTPDGLKIRAYVIPARERIVALHELRGLDSAKLKQRGMEEAAAWDAVKDTSEAVEYARSRPTVVMFHANAGNVGHRIPLARKFVSELHCNVFMLSYRGYGHSEGFPSEAGIKVDAATAMEYISTHPILSKTKLVLYGQSIGGAVVLDTAAAFPDMVSGAIIENTFVSLESLVPSVMPMLPPLLVRLLLSERWDAATAIPKIRKDTPILFLSGRRDELVPQAQMLALRELRRRTGGKCRWREFPEGTHNDTYVAPSYWEEIGAWLREEVEGEKAEKV
ncbi:alpha/beta-hydrolase [Cutaneotrichosporon oleaginosum]|uniref:Alpha/beta-hydrolase n=1 Tax=Cutaneotrichosporon oleaginosum TaxID=879819 RepID=A0A0J0XV92_9TREE|nr:alpha/beta-hydrolase [Cutaneotrichosporon oleaginosum]KLT44985.1 alpha/beta-hydrolase [Cutaneotrichosporon oleaginosum]